MLFTFAASLQAACWRFSLLQRACKRLVGGGDFVLDKQNRQLCVDFCL
ncbi:hypothetical protein HMPREF0658_1016 [Hoylesella marshii DSM 16973 = JCM 13450]|uniref:Uncharacterized protein n=1 Tax=Hoylesella marshii DSM 16973 = JCM 13450 TaxID=862515 RepID=E0NS65_9BACT|nr:hypothetical protein HMPREF0658_1016 [Hoylesella marshii DSM 16973 = JCM 13450]